MKKYLALSLILCIMAAPLMSFADDIGQQTIDKEATEIEQLELLDSNEFQDEDFTSTEEIEDKIDEEIEKPDLTLELNEATAAVEKAEDTLSIEDYDIAKELVKGLSESQEKTILGVRLELLYKIICSNEFQNEIEVKEVEEVEMEDQIEEAELQEEQEELEIVQEDINLSEELENNEENNLDSTDSQDIGRIDEILDMLPEPNPNDTLIQSIENIITRIDDIHVNVRCQELESLKSEIKDLPSGAEKSKLIVQINSIEIMRKKQYIKNISENLVKEK